MPLHLVGKQCLHETLVLQQFTPQILNRHHCCSFYTAKESHKLVKIWMAGHITEIAKPCKHGVVAEIGGEGGCKWKWASHGWGTLADTGWQFLFNIVLPIPDRCFLAICYYTSAGRRPSYALSVEKFRQFHQHIRTDTLSCRFKFCWRSSTMAKQNTIDFCHCYCLWRTVKQILQHVVRIIHGNIMGKKIFASHVHNKLVCQ